MKILIGNIFESGAQTLVNTVNCVGIMGKGIAAEFKKRFPKMFEDYLSRCERKEVRPGVPYLFKESIFPPQIINFPTKSHWRAASRIEDIEKGLKIISEKYKEWGVESIAIPPLGCGNGQLLWESVGPLIYKYMSKWDIAVKMYAPYDTSPAQLTVDFLLKESRSRQVGTGDVVLQKLNPAWVALTEIVYRIEQQKYHMPVGRTIFQKIAYVASVLGLPTGLSYVKGSYGPYCRELNNVKRRLANAGLIQEQRSGNMFRVLPGPEYEKARSRNQDDIKKWDTLIAKTADLFLRLDTNKAEVVATVLFAEKELNKNKNISEQGVLDAVMQWKQKRRPPLNKEEVAETIRNLGVLGWFSLEPSHELPINESEF
ncbi:MAG: macro domain-containing protein [Candidatus Omnitrophota bacterium]|nr:macro domain-containing protein [Candidatus Omnitrophota bacterium]